MRKNYSVKIIDPLADSRWDKFIAHHKQSTIYHHSLWCEVLKKSFKHMDAMYCIIEDGEINIKAGLPLFSVRSWLTGNRLVSVPFASVCIPLVSTPGDFKILTSYISDILEADKYSYFEIRMRNDSSFLTNGIFNRLYKAKCHVLPLNTDIKSLRKSFHYTSIRQRIKRAERDGLQARVGESERDMKTFYHLLSVQRQKKFGLPPHPYSIFRNMWELLYPKGMLDLHLIEYDNNTIAGMLVLKFNNTAISEHAASDSKYLKMSPNQLLWWKAIEHSHKGGCEYFDMGKSDDNTGLIEFKRRWQPEEYSVYHLFYPQVKGVYASDRKSLAGQFMNYLWRHAPLSLSRMGSTFLYNHMG